MGFIADVKNKKKRQENTKQKQQTDYNRESGQQLISALNDADMSLSGIENPETRRVFQRISKSMAEYIDNSAAIGHFSTEEMDQTLLQMISAYSEALKNNDLATAKRGYERIYQGLHEFRKDLTELELARKDEIIKEREKKLDQFKMLLVTSQKMYTNYQNLHLAEKEYLELKEEYEKLYEKLDKQIEEHPDTYEALQIVRPGIDEVTVEMQELDNAIQRVVDMSRRADTSRSDMLKFETEFYQQKASLESMESMLKFKDGSLTEEEEKRMEEITGEYIQRMLNAVEESRKLEKLRKRRYHAMGEINSSMSTGAGVMEHYEDYELLKSKRQMLEEEAERGRILRQQNEQKKNENQKQVITH